MIAPVIVLLPVFEPPSVKVRPELVNPVAAWLNAAFEKVSVCAASALLLRIVAPPEPLALTPMRTCRFVEDAEVLPMSSRVDGWDPAPIWMSPLAIVVGAPKELFVFRFASLVTWSLRLLAVLLPITVLPVKVFASLVSASVPEPAITNEVAAPPMTELMVWVALLTVIVCASKLVRVPPETTTAPEPEAKVMLPALTVPETVMVPAPRPVIPLPKKTRSVVAVVTSAGSNSPVVLVVQPCVASPVVGTVQVPVAVPKPAVAPSESQ